MFTCGYEFPNAWAGGAQDYKSCETVWLKVTEKISVHSQHNPAIGGCAQLMIGLLYEPQSDDMTLAHGWTLSEAEMQPWVHVRVERKGFGGIFAPQK